MSIQKSVKLFVLATFAASTVACGEITLPMTLALQGDTNVIEMSIPATAPVPTAVLELEGGVGTEMVVSLSLLDLIFQQGIFTQIVITELLFAAPPFSILNQNTEEVCVTQDEGSAGGGMAFIDIFQGLISFDMSLATVVLLGNDALAAAIPGGFPFAIDVSETAELSLIDMLGLVFGSAEGGLALSQVIDDVIVTEIEVIPGAPPLELEIGIHAEMTLGTASEFPTSPLLDECIAFLNE